MPNLLAASETPTAAVQLNPGPIFETLKSYQHAMALKGAIELDVFTHISQGASTPAGIAAKCHASTRGVRILCDFLTIDGFLVKTDGHYSLTTASAKFLSRTSPAYVGDAAAFLAGPEMLEGVRDIAELVRKGSKLTAADIAGQNHRWVKFARSMTGIVRIVAESVAAIVAQPGRALKVLDVAAGSGVHGIAVARANPAAEITALDYVEVLEVAQENAVAAGVQGRYHNLSGDAFEVDLGRGYDLVLVPNFLHNFDPAENIRFLKRLRAAMNPGGRVATVEFVPNDDRITPAIPAAFSLTMLANTECGDAYTFRELEHMFREAGFGRSHQRPLPPTPETLILTAF